MVSVNLVANTNLQTVDEFRQLVVKQKDGVVVRLGEIADVELGAENYDEDVRFNGQTATFMGIWVLPTANSLDVIKRVRAALPEIQQQLPGRHEARHPVRLDGLHPGRDRRGAAHADGDAAHRHHRDLPVPRLVPRRSLIPIVAIPISLIGAVFLMLVAGFTINLLTLLAIVLSVGLVVDDAIVMVENVERHLQLGEKPFDAAIDAARELVGPIIAMTITLAAVYAPDRHPGRPDGRALPRVRLHARGRRHRLRRRRPDAVSDDGLAAPARGRRRARLRGMDQPPLRRASAAGTGACSPAASSYRPVVFVLWADRRRADRSVLHVLAARSSRRRRTSAIVFGVVQAAPNATLDQTKLFSDKVYDVYQVDARERERLPDHATRPAVSAAWSPSPGASARRRRRSSRCEASMGLSKIPGVRVISLIPPALPGGGNFPVDFVIASTAEPAAARRVRQPARRQGVRERASSCTPTRT